MSVRSRIADAFVWSEDEGAWVAKSLRVPLFDNRTLESIVRLKSIDGLVPAIDDALHNLLALGAEEKFFVSEHVFRHCKEALESFVTYEEHQPMVELTDPARIWDFVELRTIAVTQRKRAHDRDIYVCIWGECDWDPEHGLQLVFRQGRALTRVSEQDRCITWSDANGTPDAEDELLSRFEDRVSAKKEAST